MDKKLSLYLQYDIKEVYNNNDAENALVGHIYPLYMQALSAHEHNAFVNPKKLEKWRKSYFGTQEAVDIRTGQDSSKKSKSIRKLVYEMVESKIDTAIPMPRLRAASKSTLALVQKTEDMLKFEIDRLLSEAVNDIAERNTYVDGTTWYKVWWNPLLKTNDPAGDVEVTVLPAEALIIQPGIIDYTKMEYCFERSAMSSAQIYDMFGKVIRSMRNVVDPSAPQSDEHGKTDKTVVDLVNIITFYFLNESRTVGRIMFTEETRTVIDIQEEWLVKKVNKNHNTDKKPEFITLKEEILSEDLYKIVNIYKPEEQADEQGNPKPEAAQNKITQGMAQGLSKEGAVDAAAPWQGELFLAKGTEVPLYKIKELPFIPRVNVSRQNSLYGVSDAEMLFTIQDELNKALTRMHEKVQRSGGILFKDKKINLGDMNEVLKIVDLNDPQLAAGSKYVDINPQVTGDMQLSTLDYESGRSTIGINNSWQGKQDTTATSGKAKEIAAMGTAGRIEAPRVMKRLAMAQLYRMIFMFKLAFSTAKVTYMKLLPEAQEVEREWDKYEFLDKDEYGNLYYHDNFAFSVDQAATLSNDRQAMWQETQQQWLNGAFGNPQDVRAQLSYWGVMEQLQYPLAKYCMASIKNTAQHLDPQTEQILMQNPQVLDLAMQVAQEQGLIEGRGGARPNSGPAGNGATHAANVAKTNAKNSGNAQGMDPKVVEGAREGGAS